MLGSELKSKSTEKINQHVADIGLLWFSSCFGSAVAYVDKNFKLRDV
jgi:hypothetical protein